MTADRDDLVWPILAEVRDTFRAYAECCDNEHSLGQGDKMLFTERADTCDRALLLLQKPKHRARERIGERVRETNDGVELAALIIDRIHSEFDGECHLSEEEARRIANALTARSRAVLPKR